MRTSREHLCFAGVGGAGMAPLAYYACQSGFRVSGFDDHLSGPAERLLEAAGILLVDALPEDADRVITSSALPADHPLLAQAQARGLPVWRRGEALSQFAQGKQLLAVVGSHGKTTTTALLVHALRRQYHAFGYVLGGFFGEGGPPPARFSDAPWLVAEIDESDGTIEHFSPDGLVLLNTDWDHPAQYPTAGDALGAFHRIAARTKTFIVATEEVLTGLPESVGAEKVVADASACATPESLWGAFNEDNVSLARTAALRMVGADSELSFADWPGLHRRQEILRETPGEVWLHDYAHHPAEITALLGAIRARWPDHAIGVLFQPHRPSRTHALKDGFVDVLSRVDPLWLLPTYGAFEAEDGAGSIDTLAQAFSPPPVVLEPTEALAALERWAASRPGNKVVAIIGAGDIEAVARQVEPASPSASTSFSWPVAVRENEPLAKRTTVQAGGPARYYAEPADEAELVGLLRTAKAHGIPVFLLGRGSNLLVADEGFDGLVVRLAGAHWERIEFREEGLVDVGAGVRLKRLCGEAAARGWSGFEFLEGVPGSIGGALRMNAGAMGGWMHDLVERVTILDAHLDVQELEASALGSDYRQCRALENAIALGARLRAPGREATAEIRARMQAYQERRRCSQPREPSPGCLFRNPEGEVAGRLIEQSGGKGFRVGGAMVSPTHANFSVNTGTARVEDFLALARWIRDTVYQQTRYVLEPEALLLGAQWEDVLPPLTTPRELETSALRHHA